MSPEGGALIREFVDCTYDQGDSSPKRRRLSSANLNPELNLNREEFGENLHPEFDGCYQADGSSVDRRILRPVDLRNSSASEVHSEEALLFSNVSCSKNSCLEYNVLFYTNFMLG